jgi:hypothetical protein
VKNEFFISEAARLLSKELIRVVERVYDIAKAAYVDVELFVSGLLSIVAGI